MIPDPMKRKVRIPIRIRGGKIAFEHGSGLPGIKDDTSGVLVLPMYAIQGDAWRDLLANGTKAEFLPKGTLLLFQISIRDEVPPKVPGIRLGSGTDIPSLGGYAYAEVRLEDPLFILLRLANASKLMPCRCRIAALKETAGSLNETYTMLSTRLEPWRRSHTGNVFEKVFAKSPAMDAWFPLKPLREEILARSIDSLRCKDDHSSLFKEGDP